jgi:chromosome segregation ATPase
VVLPVVGLAAIAVTARQPSQDTSQQPADDPVAEAARKAREHKKEAPKPKKVYTNDDVSTSAASAAPATAAAKTDDAAKSTPAEANAEATADAAKGDKNADKNSEAAWRKRFKEAREKLAQTEKELDILQREVNKAQTQFYSDPQKALSEQYTRKNINEHDTQIAAKKEEVAQLKQQLSDLEDELRKSGGDIGWSRE